MMKTPSFLVAPLTSLLYHLVPFCSLLLLLSASLNLLGLSTGLRPHSYSTVQYSTVQYSTVQHYTALHYTTIQYTALNYTTLH